MSPGFYERQQRDAHGYRYRYRNWKKFMAIPFFLIAKYSVHEKTLINVATMPVSQKNNKKSIIRALRIKNSSANGYKINK